MLIRKVLIGANGCLKLTKNILCGPLREKMLGRPRTAGACTAPATPPRIRLTVEQAVDLWASRFRQAGVSEPLLSSQYIIAHLLGGKTLESLGVARLAAPLTQAEAEQVWHLCARRLTSMPVQYVIEEWDFRDLTLKMRPPVFIPRPETEELVGLVLADLQEKQGTLVDEDAVLKCLEVGCGSGAISLSLTHSIPQLRAFALDKSQAAVDLTRENAQSLGLQDRVEVHQLDMMKDTEVIVRECGPVTALVSNPPYLYSEEMTSLQPEIIRFEDHTALDGGVDGMCVIRQILALAPLVLSEHGRVYLEVDPRHLPLIRHLVSQTPLGLEYIDTHRDHTGRPRFCILEKAED